MERNSLDVFCNRCVLVCSVLFRFENRDKKDESFHIVHVFVSLF